MSACENEGFVGRDGAGVIIIIIIIYTKIDSSLFILFLLGANSYSLLLTYEAHCLPHLGVRHFFSKFLYTKISHTRTYIFWKYKMCFQKTCVAMPETKIEQKPFLEKKIKKTGSIFKSIS